MSHQGGQIHADINNLYILNPKNLRTRRKRLRCAFIPGPNPWPRPGISRCGNGKSGIHKQ